MFVNENNIENYSIQPYFNGDNTAFFEENVYISKDDILCKENVVTMKDVFIKQTINLNQFGKLFILNNGKIHTSLLRKPIGEFGKDSIHSILYKELKENKNLYKTRDKLIPCKNCLYNFLCPPISNYEKVIKKQNLCNVY